MFHSRVIVAAAMLAFGALAASPAMAGGKNGGGHGGGGGGGYYTRIICIVNGHRFETTDEHSCYGQRKYVYGYRHIRFHFEGYRAKRRHLPVCGCAYTQGGYAGGYEGYGYYTGGSVAARMQAERRGMAMTDGGVYGDSYGYGDGDYSLSRRHYKKLRRNHGYDNGDWGYEAGYSYNPGYVIHYGPTISKDGGY